LSESGVDTQSPAFLSAQSACQKLLPGGLPGAGTGSESRKQQMVKLAACMRAHGLTTFPDPTNSPPPAHPPANGLALFTPGGSFSLSASIVQSPGFKQAGAACGFPSVGRGFTTPVAPTGG
jgi:hypothetical protein